jgi:hypothetical protein
MKEMCLTCHKKFVSLPSHHSQSWHCNPKTPGLLALPAPPPPQDDDVDVNLHTENDDNIVPPMKRTSNRIRRPGRRSFTSTPTAMPRPYSSLLNRNLRAYSNCHSTGAAIPTDISTLATIDLMESDEEDETGNQGDWVILHNLLDELDEVGAVARIDNTSSVLAISHPPSQVPAAAHVEHDTAVDMHFPIGIQDAMEFVAAPSDRSMAELYSLSDKAGAPRGLVDDLISKMKEERVKRNFSPFMPGITRRDAFFSRVSKKTAYHPPSKIPITLESGQRVCILHTQVRLPSRPTRNASFRGVR